MTLVPEPCIGVGDVRRIDLADERMVVPFVEKLRPGGGGSLDPLAESTTAEVRVSGQRAAHEVRAVQLSKLPGNHWVVVKMPGAIYSVRNVLQPEPDRSIGTLGIAVADGRPDSSGQIGEEPRAIEFPLAVRKIPGGRGNARI